MYISDSDSTHYYIMDPEAISFVEENLLPKIYSNLIAVVDQNLQIE